MCLQVGPGLPKMVIIRLLPSAYHWLNVLKSLAKKRAMASVVLCKKCVMSLDTDIS